VNVKGSEVVKSSMIRFNFIGHVPASQNTMLHISSKMCITNDINL